VELLLHQSPVRKRDLLPTPLNKAFLSQYSGPNKLVLNKKKPLGKCMQKMKDFKEEFPKVYKAVFIIILFIIMPLLGIGGLGVFGI
jgi:hypothetical protein